jgi:predicted enzyme related to lactoylglutathione lyase
MENVISVLVNRYERGSISRRELIRGLAMLAATSSTATAADSAIQVTGIDHVSIQASDIQRSAKFYQDVFGLPFLNEDKKTETIRLTAGNGRIAIRHGSPAGVVDHFAFAIAHLDVAAVTEEMKRHGVTPYGHG